MKKTRVQLQLSKGRSCIYCSKNDGSTVPHHYKGFFQQEFWHKTKVNDLMTMDLCFTCHDAFHNSNSFISKQSKEDKTDLQFRLIEKTIKRDIAKGNLICDIDIVQSYIVNDQVKNFKELITMIDVGLIKYIKK